MNQERFDELAKAVAAPVSRAQMLKMLGGAFLGSALGSWGTILGAGDAQARRRRKKKKKRHPFFSPPPLTCPSCGTCTEVDIDTSTGNGTQGECTNPCTAATLCQQANLDTSFQELAHELSSEGFVVDGEPQALVIYEDGSLAHSGIGAAYSKSTTSEKARLYYVKDASGQTLAYGSVLDSSGHLEYSLAVGSGGQVQKGYPPEGWPPQQQPATSGSSSSVTNASSPRAANSSGISPATTTTPQQCASECEFFCGKLLTTGICFLTGIGCMPAALAAGPAAPFVIAICLAIAGTCEYAGNLACDGLCQEFCACPPGTWPYGNMCCKACENGQTSSGGSAQCVPKQCGQCEKCDPNTGSCATGCGSGGQCCNGKCCTPGQVCNQGVCVDKCGFSQEPCSADYPVCCQGQCYAAGCSSSCDTWDPSTCQCVFTNCSCNTTENKTCYGPDGTPFCCRPGEKCCPAHGTYTNNCGGTC